jgi:hypothetical protein
MLAQFAPGRKIRFIGSPFTPALFIPLSFSLSGLRRERIRAEQCLGVRDEVHAKYPLYE